MTFDDEDALVARLLRAGRADGPSARALRAAPLAVGALLTSTAAHAALSQVGGAAVAEVGRAVSPLVLVKWIAVGTLAGSSLMAVVRAPELLRQKSEAEAQLVPQRAASLPAATAASAKLAELQPAPELPPDADPAAASSLPSSVTSAPRPDVAREVSLLDAARRALVQGNPAEALRLLATLERLPARALMPEATVLQVRALLAQGSRDEARAVSERFCKSAAASPQCAILRTLVATSVIQPRPSRL